MKGKRLLLLAAVGDLFLYSAPLVRIRGVRTVVTSWFEWVGLEPRSLDLLDQIDRASSAPLLFLAIGALCGLIAWTEEAIREVLLGGWVLTAMLIWLAP